MSQKNKKQFGIWMDTHHATVIGRASPDTIDFSVLGMPKMPALNLTPMKKMNTMKKKHCSTNFLKKYLPTCKMLRKCI